MTDTEGSEDGNIAPEASAQQSDLQPPPADKSWLEVESLRADGSAREVLNREAPPADENRE